ncbi:crossover junction endodeoxyribonuclease RuvC [Rhodopirellula sp. JC740]|uniref:Crossover junction endodeoxyribonuclease RuvC n=1 Tax=Rhodopirellula halodulae TaxID=2894198 RepID=A0ABS8NMN1_9BACT|nr:MULTISPECIES: crossover junction endodeoxyribonuclease RuvC [unclassified Rhodopirellula]MCC9644815.1 crossover junction endodeoxyribonuclease RuvC [Rhodopirellula sp. JC740]MCC9658555.1 crossover junction endodeoxyribonuclease RuvC [Rhodopirellula sp. JC737]
MGTQVVTQRPAAAKCILGIDPGINTTGYAVISREGPRLLLREAGVIRSRGRDELPVRLREIHDGLSEVFSSHPIELMALEQLFSHYERPRTAILMGHARGVICLAAATAGVRVEHYEPTRVKKVMTGNGRAPKSQIQLAVKMQLNLQSVPEPADVADAMAISLCGHYLSDNPIDQALA